MGSVSRALETYLAYRMLDLIATPFTEWRAFELGLIDGSGKKIKEAKNEEEKEQFSKFMNITRNLKRILSKYANVENKLSAVLIGTSLLKEEKDNKSFDVELVEQVLLESLTNNYNEQINGPFLKLEAGTYKFTSEFYEFGETIVYINEGEFADTFGIFRVDDLQGNRLLGTIEDFTRIK